MTPIRLVTFDALHTIITPRRPIHVQYSEVFAPFVGVLPPDRIKHSFKAALKAVQTENPTYNKGAQNWWQEVIRRTALDAGADQKALDDNLSTIVDQLMVHFSSREGYEAFDDAIPTIRRLHEQFGVKTAIISNGDSRINAVLRDLGFPEYLSPIVLSEEEGISKPSPEIFTKTLKMVNRRGDEHDAIHAYQSLHVGDELVCDYHGALGAGMNALLLRRPGPAGEQEHKEVGEQLEGVHVIGKLNEVEEYVRKHAESGLA